MKKSYILLSAVVALFAACSDNDSFKEVVNGQQTEQALSFSAFANKVTKGTNSTALNDFYTVFGVYSWKTVNGQVVSDAVFDNHPNEYFTVDGSGSTVYKTSGKPSVEWNLPSDFGTGEGKKGYWYYESVRYWDKMASSYQFFAIAPYEATPTYTVSAGNHNISIATNEAMYDISTEKNLALAANTENGPIVPQAALSFSGFKKDYMIADKVTVSPTANVTSSDLQLTFHHILTKLNVKIQMSSAYKGVQTLKVNKFEIANLAKKAYFEMDGDDMTADSWTKASKATEGNKYSLKVETAYALANAEEATDNHTGKYWIETLIFPQATTCQIGGPQATATNLTDCYLFIQYQIGEEKYNVYYDLAYVFDNTLVYSAEEAKDHNAGLTGALAAETNLSATDASAYNSKIENGGKNENDQLTPAEAAAYNATLDDAVKENDVKVPGSKFDFRQGSQYNLTLTVGPEPIHFDASVTEWDDVDKSLSVN